jgi:hypothetical protein
MLYDPASSWLSGEHPSGLIVTILQRLNRDDGGNGVLVNHIVFLVDLDKYGKIVKTQHPALDGDSVHKIDRYLHLLLARDIQKTVLKIFSLISHCTFLLFIARSANYARASRPDLRGQRIVKVYSSFSIFST